MLMSNIRWYFISPRIFVSPRTFFPFHTSDSSRGTSVYLALGHRRVQSAHHTSIYLINLIIVKLDRALVSIRSSVVNRTVTTVNMTVTVID